MKKPILMLCLAALITGCSNPTKENQINKDNFNEAIKIAEQSTENVSELPLNFKFGMTREEVNENLDNLVKDSIITRRSDYYIYEYTLGTGKKISTYIEFRFYEDRLYRLHFPISGFSSEVDQTLFSAIDNEICNKVDSTYNRYSYYEAFDSGNRFNFTAWVKGNQYIILKKVYGADIEFINAPINRILLDLDTQKIIDKVQQKAGVKVENSSIDGSVSQVKRYLKNNLKDPDSYEGIEWSDVVETDNGYTVRHKYRAKNSLGGYVVENQIFYLDLQGNVKSVSSY